MTLPGSFAPRTPVPPHRRGACPALATPMQTGDGLLTRLPAQVLAPDVLEALAGIAAEAGNGLIEVTARGSIQLRGLTAASAAALPGQLAALGITGRDGVAIETSPLAGRDPAELADPRPVAAALARAIEAAGLNGRLAPKVVVTVDGGGEPWLAPLVADLRLTAGAGPDGPGWRLSVAGTGASARPLGSGPAEAVIGAVVTALARIADAGPAARARDLLAAGGFAAGAVMSGLMPSGDATPVVAPDGAPFVPLAGHPLRPRGGSAGEADVAVGVALPFGQSDAAALAALARAACAGGVTAFVPAPGRILLALGPAAAVEACRAAAEALGFVVDPADPRTRIAACPGAPACASGLISARVIAADVATEEANGHHFDSGRTDTVVVHISGCAKGCAHPGPASVTLVGREDGTCGVIAGGSAAAAPIAAVASGDVPAYWRAAARHRGHGVPLVEALRRAARELGAPVAQERTS